MPLRVLRIHPSLDPHHGGIVSSLTATTAALQGMADVTVLTCDSDPGHQAPILASGAAVVALPRLRWRSMIRAAASSIDLVIIEGAWQPLAPGVSKECTRAGIPYLYVPHGALSSEVRTIHPSKHLKKLVWWVLFEHRVMTRAAATWFASRAELERSVHTFPGTVRNGTVLPFCVDDLGLPATPRPVGGTRVMTAARIAPVKRIDVLLRALGTLPAEWTLDIAGTALPGASEDLGVLARDLGVHDRVTWHGHLDRSELRQLMHDSDAYVAAGIESFGMSVVEAMSTNLPTVVSDRVATSNWLPGAPWVVPYGDVASLARSLRAVTGLGGEHADLRGLYEATFSAGAFRSRFWELVEQVVGRSTAHTANHQSSADGKPRRR